MKGLRQFIKGNKGSSIVFATGAMTFILILAAVVVALGTCYLSTSNLQNAVDAAALAAGGGLPCGSCDTNASDALRSMASRYLTKNGVGADSARTEPSDIVNGKYTGVSVTASMTVATSFARIIGINSLTITRHAKAVISPVTKATGLVPLSVDRDYLSQTMASGQTQHLTLKFGATTGVQGSFGAVDLDGSKSGGASDYECNLLDGYDGAVTVGTILPVEPGNMSGPTFDAFWSRYNSCTHFSGQGGCGIDHYVKGCPRVVMVPVVNYITSKSVEICGFAAFILEAGTGDGVQSTVTGSFVNLTAHGTDYDENGAGSADDFGVYSVHLTN